MTFKDILASFGAAPKTLDSAKEQIDLAAPVLAEVSQMFANAGLDLDAMRAAGPDALKAHIDSFKVADEALAKVQGELVAAAVERDTALESLAEAEAECSALDGAFKAVGFEVKDVATAKADFDSFVKSQAALELAKAGHPPVKAIVLDAPLASEGKSDRDHFLTYKAMVANKDPNRTAYLVQFGDQIFRGQNAA